MGKNKNVQFGNPPVIEVVFQVGFPKIEGIGTPHFGLFWASIRDDFPIIHTAGRLGPIEIPTESRFFPENRLWLIHKSSNTLIQLQDNCFLFNWRLTGAEQTYPGYEKLYPEFIRYLKLFLSFLESENSPIESFSGFELQYVNHIYLSGDTDRWEKAGNSISIFQNPGVGEKDFPLKSIKFTSTSDIAKSTNNLIVNVESRVHKETQKELLNFEIRVVGQRESLILDSLDDEFTAAHDQALDAFLRLSTRKSQRSWKPE